jgi:butyryl-CoA dehydrogenase
LPDRSKELKSKAFAHYRRKRHPRIQFGKFEKKIGLRGTQNCDLVFEDCRIPKENLLGKEAKASRSPCRPGWGRIGIAAQSVGIAREHLR